MPDKNEEEILKAMDRAMDDIIDSIFTKSQENIVEEGAVDRGTLLKSGNVNRKFLEKEIVYSAPHAVFVEFGTDPHMPPVDPIMEWARRKLGLPEDEARRVAWAIAKKIEKEGTPGIHFMEKAILEEIRSGRIRKL